MKVKLDGVITLLWVGESEDVTFTEDDSAAGVESRLISDHFTVDVTQGGVQRTHCHRPFTHRHIPPPSTVHASLLAQLIFAIIAVYYLYRLSLTHVFGLSVVLGANALALILPNIKYSGHL